MSTLKTGYARVSTDDEDVAAQRNGLQALGATKRCAPLARTDLLLGAGPPRGKR